jgi:hypothetical protein
MLQNPFNLLKEVSVDNPVQPRDGVVQEADPLSLAIEDKELREVFDKRIADAKKFFEDRYELTMRREKNERYLFGRQISQNEKANRYRPYEAKYQDNALYEIESSIKPIALSRLPEMIITPGNNTQEAQETAKNLSLIVNTDLKKRENRQILSLGFKHLPVYFTGIVKVRWNPESGEYGDYEFEIVHPENIVVDEQCPTKNADDMDFVCQYMKLTVQDCVMRFPEAKEKLFKELTKSGVNVKDGNNWKAMASTIKIAEVWFTWYVKKADDKENNLYERVEGVMWKYGDVILKKMRNPNFDYEGQEKYFTYEVPGDKSTRREATPEELSQAAIVGIIPDNFKKEKTYRNYFDAPRKPFYFLGYDQWGKVAYDETSRIEQNIYNQENMDAIGKRVIEKLKDRGKHTFSKDSGLQGKDIERMDLNNPDQDLLVDGDVNKVHGYIPPIEPTQQEFAELKNTRERMFSVAGATNLNGQLQTNVATSNQIAREANYTRVDDLTEDTINAAAEWMADNIMQFIKLRYTDEHMRKLLGAKGSITFIKLTSNMIEEGMEVNIKASGTDKIQSQNNAMQMAKMKMIDPLTFFEDMDLSDPEGRAEKLMMFMQDPAGYLMTYVNHQTIEDMAQTVINAETPPAGMEPQGAAQIGAPTPPPAGPTPTNTAQVATQPPTGVAASPANGML